MLGGLSAPFVGIKTDSRNFLGWREDRGQVILLYLEEGGRKVSLLNFFVFEEWGGQRQSLTILILDADPVFELWPRRKDNGGFIAMSLVVGVD